MENNVIQRNQYKVAAMKKENDERTKVDDMMQGIEYRFTIKEISEFKFSVVL